LVADVVMRSYQQASSLARDRMIETENHHCVGIAENRIVDWQALTRLINSLVDDDRLPCGLSDDVLESNATAANMFLRKIGFFAEVMLHSPSCVTRSLVCACGSATLPHTVQLTCKHV
jgi:hypothetical protein